MSIGGPLIVQSHHFCLFAQSNLHCMGCFCNYSLISPFTCCLYILVITLSIVKCLHCFEVDLFFVLVSFCVLFKVVHFSSSVYMLYFT